MRNRHPLFAILALLVCVSGLAAQNFESNDEEILRIAEETRTKLYKKWFELDEVAWESKCAIIIQGSPFPGRTAIVTEGGRVVSRSIELSAFNEDVLRHEVAHACLAGMFGGKQTPRWVDEGIAVLSESKRKIRYRREFGLQALMNMDEYPRKLDAFYAQSVGLVEFLAAQKSPKTLVEFIRDGMDEKSLQKHYGFTFEQLEEKLGQGADAGAIAAPVKKAVPAPAKLTDSEQLSKLAAALKSWEVEERLAALNALDALLSAKRNRALDLDPVLDPLFNRVGFNASHERESRWAEDLLVRIGKPALPLLKERLKSQDPHHRRMAAVLLVRIGPLDTSLAALVRPLLADRDHFVRRAAIEALSTVGPAAEAAVKDLEAVATSDAMQLLRVLARAALIRVDGASDERVRALAAMLEPTVKWRDPSDKEFDPETHLAPRFAAMHLRKLKGKAGVAVPELVAALKNADSGVRVNAAAALGPVGAFNTPQSIASLIDILENDRDRDARIAAAGALGEIGPKAKAAIPALRSALKGDGKAGWWVAADALGKIGSAEVVPALMEGLASPDEGIRGASIKSLGSLGDIAKPALAALEKARQDDARAEIRAAAADALRRIEQATTRRRE